MLKRLMAIVVCAGLSFAIADTAAAQLVKCKQDPQCGAGPCKRNNGERNGVCSPGPQGECTRCLPTVTEWGVANMGILLLAAGTIAIRLAPVRRVA